MRCYIGSYTRSRSNGIYIANFERGKLEVIGVIPAVNPSWVTISNEKLFAVREEKPGSITMWNLNDDSIELEAQWFSGGDDPCHLTTWRRHLYCANYSSGSLSMSNLDDISTGYMPKLYQHTGNSVHPTRQTKPHVHQSLVTPDGKYLAVTDLGNDTVQFCPICGNGEIGKAETIHIPAGNGPRHLIFGKKRIWYLLCELTCAIFVFEGYGKDAIMLQQTGESFRRRAGAGAAIRVSNKKDILCVSIRETNLLEMYRIDDGGVLKYSDCVSCHGACPRDVALIDDRYVLCACQESGEITVFQIENGKLNYNYSIDIPEAACIYPVE